MSNDAQTALATTQAAAPGWFTSIDYLLNSAQRVAEGVVGFQLLNSEAKARQAQAQWQAAAYNQLYQQQVGSPGSPWGGAGGVGGIQLPGVTGAAGGGGSLLLLGLAAVAAYAIWKA